MCIRDSFPWCVAAATGGDMALGLPFNTKFKGVEPNGRMWYTCLLYTSDAADERSSVDLGGRRIIKKKKKIEIYKRKLLSLQNNDHPVDTR